MSVRKTLLCLGLAVSASGCPSSNSHSSAGSQADEAGYTVEVTGSEQVASQTCFSVTDSDSFQSFAWTVADAGSSPSSDYLGCSAQNQAELCCIFQSTGAKTVTLNAVDQFGDAQSVHAQVSIALATGATPAIIVDVRTATGTLLGTFSQDPGSVTNVPIPSLAMNTVYDFDMGRSEANAGSGSTALTYQASFGQGFTTLPGPVATHSFATSGYYPVTFQVTNSLGNTSIAQIQIYIECANSAGYDFSLDPAQLTVTSSSVPNQYTYSFAGVVVGGAGTPAQFQYLLDLNGDGIYDTPWQPLTTSTYSGYSLYVSGTQYPLRPISLEVWDTQCNIVHSVTVPTTLSAPTSLSAASPSFPGSGLTGYDFIQADVDALPNTPPIGGLGLSFLGTQPVGTSNGHMTCNYIRSGTDPTNPYIAGQDVSVSLTAQAKYTDADNNPKSPHSLDLNIIGITDRTGEVGNSQPLNTSNAALSSVTYTTDSQPDVQQQYGFHNDQTCQLTNFKLTPQGTPPVCDGTPGSVQAPSYMANVQGDYFCPHLINSYPLGIDAAIKIGDRGTGHFYCQIPIPNYCRQLHECVDGAWTDTGGACCTDGCQTNPPSPPGGGGGPPGGSTSGGSGGGGGGGGSSNNPPPPPPAPITPR